MPPPSPSSGYEVVHGTLPSSGPGQPLQLDAPAGKYVVNVFVQHPGQPVPKQFEGSLIFDLIVDASDRITGVKWYGPGDEGTPYDTQVYIVCVSG